MICLIRPPAVDSIRFATTSITLPLGLAYIAAALEGAGHAVTVIDAVGQAPQLRSRYLKGYLIGLRYAEIVRRIPREASAVGLSVTFTHEWPSAVALIEAIKQARPELPVILGGEHVTSMPEFCLMTSAADLLVLGEGEQQIVELVGALASGGEIDGITGIAFRVGGEIVVTPRRPRNEAVDDLPLPAWHHFEIETYHRHGLIGCEDTPLLTIPILATRGCPYQCTYCSAPNMWSPRWIPRDPVKVADEIEGWVRRYGARNFPFQDLTAIVRKDWIVTFCNELIRRDLGITWRLPSGTRAEAIDDEVAHLLRRSGMVSMAYAPESGSDETRRLIKKKMHGERLLESVRSAAAADLYVMAFTVIGFPHDTERTLAESLPFLEQLAVNGVSDMSVSFYMALPGTQLFHSLWDAGRLRLDRAYFGHILESLSFVPRRSWVEGLSRADLARWKLRSYRAFYGARRAAAGETGGLGREILRQVRQIARGEDRSRMQTALRNGLRTMWQTARAQLAPGWVSRQRERRFFDGWHGIYARIRAEKLRSGVAAPAPADTRELHRTNVVTLLEGEHRHARRLRFEPAPAPLS